jgi:hypothetical protein
MMRRLVERHRGILPLDTAESIWRVIIATFTYVQAPFRVHADISAGDAEMRDSERFHFGFTVPFEPHANAASVVAAVAASQGDLGLVPATGAMNAWWQALENGPAKIIARLPFVERANHPAGLPVFAIARPHPDALVTDVAVWSINVAGWGPKGARALAKLTDVVAVPHGEYDAAALLVSVPQPMTIGEVIAALNEAGVSVRSQALVGSHARRYTVAADGAVASGR